MIELTFGSAGVCVTCGQDVECCIVVDKCRDVGLASEVPPPTSEESFVEETRMVLT